MRQNEDGLNEAPNDVPAKRTRTNITTESPLRSSICFFCNEVGSFSSDAKKNEKNSTFLHRVTTMNRDRNILECAIQMGDTKLLAKLSEGDMVAREACYHLRCMTKFNNTYRSFVKKNVDPDQQKQKKYESIALAEVMNFVEEGLQVNSGEALPFLKLSEIRKYYCGCLKRMNAPSTTANATRLKEKLLKLNTIHLYQFMKSLMDSDHPSAMHIFSFIHLVDVIPHRHSLAEEKSLFMRHGSCCQN